MEYLDLIREFQLETNTPTVYHRGQLLCYNNRHYEEISLDDFGLMLKKWRMGKGRELKRAGVAEAVQTALADCHTGHKLPLPFWEGIDAPDPAGLIPFRNGILDTGDMTLREHSP